MTDQSKQPANEPSFFDRATKIARRPYSSPSLVVRAQLSRIAADSKVSGVSISDRRLKEDVRLVGRTFDGLNVYIFRYKNEPVARMGVMAQEVLKVHPEAVGEINGYLAVDYGKIGNPPIERSQRGEEPSTLSDPPQRTARRPYGKPSVLARERLSRITALLTKPSGISSDT